MGKRKGKWKGRSDYSKTLKCCRRVRKQGQGNETESGTEEKGGRFFACYLLTSLSPRHKGHTYIGFTVNPRRRIRQHNGEITSGAGKTKSKRPWEIVLCIYGFPTNVSALQFEWAWQHPTESLAVKDTATTFKSLSGLANKVKLGYTMLTLPTWQNLNLTVNFFSTKYTKHSAGLPSLPEQMRVQVCPMDELPCYTSIDPNTHKDEDDVGDDDDDEICHEPSSAYGSMNKGLTDITIDSNTDHWLSYEETCGHKGCIEDMEMQESGYLLSSIEDHRPVEDYICALIEDGDELDQLTGKNFLPTLIAANNDQPPMSSPIASSDVAVIDLLTPSPGYRISSSSKKRKVYSACSEVIDLTKSPIFV